MSDQTEPTQVIEIIIKVVRNEQTLTSKDWVRGGTESTREDTEYGFTPQVTQVTKVERTLLALKVKELDVPEIVRAILNHSGPLV